MVRYFFVLSLLIGGFILRTIEVSAQETIPTTSDQPVPLLSPVPIETNVPEVNLWPGIKSPYVRKLQEILKLLGYLPANLETTVNLGPLTTEALKKFQQDNNLPAYGFFGPATRKALKNRLKAMVTKPIIDRNVDLNCMKTAVEKREDALLAAWETYSNKVKEARYTRKADLLAAWSIEDPAKRYLALKTAWEKYRTSVMNAQKEWNQSRKTIWNEFTRDAKRCKPSALETQDLEKVEVQEQ